MVLGKASQNSMSERFLQNLTAHSALQTSSRDSGPVTTRSQVFPDDKWRAGGEDSQGCHSRTTDKFGRPEESAGGVGQAIQKAAGGDGEVEG